MRTLILIILFCFCAWGVASAQTVVSAQIPVPMERHWKVEGVDRVALVYAPPMASTTKTPILFAFHGHGGSMRVAQKFGYHRIWPEAISVCMQGLPTPGALTDPEGKKNGWQRTAGDQQDRDLKFFDAVLAALKQQYKIDEKRIFVTGHSNGGGFTYLLWAERGETLAAVAPVAAGVGRNLLHLKPKPALHIAGENDALVRFPMQKRTMDAIRKLNGVEAEGKPWTKSGTLVGTLYASKSGTPFVSVLYPGGHAFPDEAPGLIVKFFKEMAAANAAAAPSSDSTAPVPSRPK